MADVNPEVPSGSERIVCCQNLQKYQYSRPDWAHTVAIPRASGYCREVIFL